MLEDLKPPVRRYECKVRTVAENLESSDSQILLEAVDSPEWGFKTLQRALKAKGITLSDTTIAAHRRRQCSCFR